MFRTLSFAAVAALGALPALACDGLSVSDPFARASGVMAQSGAVFMTLKNEGGADCRLVAARSDISDRLELHTHEEDDAGVMRMIEIEGGIVIPAGGERRLERGGDHVMFMGLTRAIEHGETIYMTLVFEDESEIEIAVPVDMERMGAHGPADEAEDAHSPDHGD
jgi:periplasmic copper chaperone A